MKFNAVVALKKPYGKNGVDIYQWYSIWPLSLPHMIDQRTVGLQFSYNLKRFSQYLFIQICYLVRNDSWTQLIICKLDHLW